MANEKHSQKSNDDLLEQSYVKSVHKVIGTKDCQSFKFPRKVLKDRISFWNSFFEKYSSNVFDEVDLDIDTLEPCVEYCPWNSLQAVQYWVNTGYLPTGKEILRMDNACWTATDVSVLDEELNSEHEHIEEKKLNSHHWRLSSINSHSNSSVDTTKYILSNMNVTNKAHAIAIMEGARHSTMENSRCERNVDITQAPIDLKNSDEGIVLCNDQNNPEYSTPRSCKISKHILQGRNTDVGNISTSKWLISDDKNRNSYSVSNGLRKRLYTISDSPIDILHMKSSNNTLTSKKKRDLHPALGFEYKSRKRKKILQKHRTMIFGAFNSSLFSNKGNSNLNGRKSKGKNKSGNPNSTNKTINKQIKCNGDVSKNSSLMINSMLDRNLIEKDDELKQKKYKLNESLKFEDKCEKNICKNVNESKKLKNLNPIVCLKALSSAEIKTYRTPKKVVTDQKCQKSNKINLEKLNPVVCLKRLNKIDIQKCKISDEKMHPVVCLKRLTQKEIQKYIKIPSTIISNPGPKDRLKILPNNVSENDMNHNNTICISPIPDTNRHQPNHSIIISDNHILAPERKRNGENRKFMNNLSSEVTKIRKKERSKTRKSDMISSKNVNMNLRGSKVNNIPQKRNLYIDNTSSSDATEFTSISIHDNINRNSNNKRTFILNISDDDDEFAKFIHSPEEILTLQRRKYYKNLVQMSNDKEKQQIQNKLDVSNNSVRRVRNSKISTNFNVCKRSTIDDTEY